MRAPGPPSARREGTSERGALRGLRILMWVVIAVEVPVYLVWLVQVGYLAEQELPRGNVARWAQPVLLPPATVLFCVTAGWTWWLSVVASTRSSLRERWIVDPQVLVAAFSVFCEVTSVDDPCRWPAVCRRDRARHDRAVLHPGRCLPPAARRRPPARLSSGLVPGRTTPDRPDRRPRNMLCGRQRRGERVPVRRRGRSHVACRRDGRAPGSSRRVRRQLTYDATTLKVAHFGLVRIANRPSGVSVGGTSAEPPSRWASLLRFDAPARCTGCGQLRSGVTAAADAPSHLLQHVLELRAVTVVSRCQNEGEGPASSVGGEMDFGGESAAGASQAFADLTTSSRRMVSFRSTGSTWFVPRPFPF